MSEIKERFPSINESDWGTGVSALPDYWSYVSTWLQNREGRSRLKRGLDEVMALSFGFCSDLLRDRLEEEREKLDGWHAKLREARQKIVSCNLGRANGHTKKSRREAVELLQEVIREIDRE